jgi:micrococcal nuclease
MKVLAVYLAILAVIVGGFWLLHPWTYLSIGSDSVNASVAGVTDGDTLTLGGGFLASRLIGVDTPEVPPGPSECYGPEASRWLKKRLPAGSKVRIEEGAEKRDRYGRALVYVWTRPPPSDKKQRPVFINARLLRLGLGRRLVIKPNDKYGKQLNRAQRAAKRAKRGLWGAC